MFRTATLNKSELSPRFVEFTEESVNIFGGADSLLYVCPLSLQLSIDEAIALG